MTPPDASASIPQEYKRAEEISLHWRSLRDKIDPQLKDTIGVLYIQYVLQLGEKTAKDFQKMAISGRLDNHALDSVGQAQVAAIEHPEGIKEFWFAVLAGVPDLFRSQDDIRFLVEQGNYRAADRLIESLHGHDYEGMAPDYTSRVLDLIQNITHNYRNPPPKIELKAEGQ